MSWWNIFGWIKQQEEETELAHLEYESICGMIDEYEKLKEECE